MQWRSPRCLLRRADFSQHSNCTLRRFQVKSIASRAHRNSSLRNRGDQDEAKHQKQGQNTHYQQSNASSDKPDRASKDSVEMATSTTSHQPVSHMHLEFACLDGTKGDTQSRLDHLPAHQGGRDFSVRALAAGFTQACLFSAVESYLKQ